MTEQELFDRAKEIIELISDLTPVNQMKVIELVEAILCSKMGGDKKTMVNGIHKHVLQLLSIQ